MAQSLRVLITGENSGLRKAVGETDGILGKLGKVGAIAGKTLAVGAGVAVAGFGLLTAAVVKSVNHLGELEKLGAQTDAVLKSTGNAAGTSRVQIEKLADSIEKTSGVSGELVQNAENVLLTFTGVKNAVGDGNDVFDQATKTIVDMSVALGTDMQGAAIQVGKALNDPIKGITALTRVGVTFTEEQKKQIKAMVEAGDVMGAQKVILAELNKEFGGSAEALGKTLPGQIAILKEHFEDLTDAIGTAVLPIFTAVVGWAGKHLPDAIDRSSAKIEEWSEKFKSGFRLGATVGIIKGEFDLVFDVANRLGKVFERAESAVQGFKLGFKFGDITSEVDPLYEAASRLGDAVRKFTDAFKSNNIGGDFIKSLDETAARAGESAVKITNALATGLNTGNWSQLSAIISGIVLSAFDSLIGHATTLTTKFITMFAAMDWGAVAAAVVRHVPGILAKIFVAFTDVGLIRPLFQGIMENWWPLLQMALGLLFMPAKWVARIAEGLGGIKFVGPFLEFGLRWFDEIGRKFLDFIGSHVLAPLARGFGLDRLAVVFAAIGKGMDGIIAHFGGGFRNLQGFLLRKWDELLGSVAGWVRGLRWADIGSDIIRGIIDGIHRGWSWLMNTVANLARAALNAAKRALGIGSPSKVASREVGSPITQGVIQGMLARIPELVAAARRMAAAAIPNVSIPAVSLGVGGAGISLPASGIAASVSAAQGGVTINVTVQGSVVSEQQLIEVVRKGLLRVGRANGSALAQLA